MVSFTVNDPVISERPPEIGPEETPGAVYTLLSKTIAIPVWLLNASPVNFSHSLAPLVFIVIDTAGRLNWSKSSLASLTTSPLILGVLSLLDFKAYKPTTSELAEGRSHTNFTLAKEAGMSLRISFILK